jgi:hypothetical protein
MADEAIKLSEASPEELQKIQHSVVRALAGSLGAGGEITDDEIYHINIIVDHFKGIFPDY